jgi:SlyX protein
VTATEFQPSLAELRAQLFDLQGQLAFQEDALQALDTVVTRQQQQIDLLERQLQRWQELVEELQGALESQREQAPPPHY